MFLGTTFCTFCAFAGVEVSKKTTRRTSWLIMTGLWTSLKLPQKQQISTFENTFFTMSKTVKKRVFWELAILHVLQI